jgi:starch-binding outer membrane protein, SusD/RagB family
MLYKFILTIFYLIILLFFKQNKNMKKLIAQPYKGLWIGLLMLGLSTACNKSFLDTNSPDGATVSSFYKTEDELNIGLTACYNSLSAQFDRLYGLGIDAIGLYCGDECESGRTLPRDFTPFENNLQTGGEVPIEIVWRECYGGIYRSNLFLEKIADATFLTPSVKERMIAEAKFLRSYFYFELIKTFGGVPVFTKTVSPAEAAAPRSTKAEVVAQIIKDFTEAIPNLPKRSEYKAADMGRITKGTAQAYLTKVYVFEKRWAEAATVGKDVVDSKEYRLLDNYKDNFDAKFDNNAESIFEAQCKSGGNGIGNAHYDLEAFEFTPNPRGYTNPKTDFVRSFGKQADGSTADPRRDISAVISVVSNTFYRSAKYTFPQSPQPVNQYDGELNYKLMRYSDFLLLYAEALNETTKTADALLLINQVRQRPSVNMPPLSNLTQTTARTAIQNERLWELGLEGHRFFDLVRWGIAGTTIRAQGRRFTDGTHELMPIPLKELQLNKQLTQNKGY